MLFLISLSMSGSYFLKKVRLNKLISEALFTTLIGFCAGLTLYLTDNDSYIYNISKGYSKMFIVFLLPPIIFESFPFK